jgi:hypothetical protein
MYMNVNWIELALNRIQWRSYVVTNVLHDNMYHYRGEAYDQRGQERDHFKDLGVHRKIILKKES